MSTLKVNSIEPANAGQEEYFLAKAWVNFNGTGTVAIRNSGNVSSITDSGVGNYQLTFSSSFIDANYASVAGVNGNNSAFNTDTNMNFRSESTGSINAISGNEGNSGVDPYAATYVATR